MSRADNQYEGSLFEYLVCQIHNKDNFYNIYEDKISQERYISILEDAKIFVLLIFFLLNTQNGLEKKPQIKMETY